MKNKVEAICLKTYPDEDDMQAYCDGDIEPCEVRIYHKGKKYLVLPDGYDEEYFKITDGLPNGKKLFTALKEFGESLTNKEKKQMFGNE